jgi:hypothetical protein
MSVLSMAAVTTETSLRTQAQPGGPVNTLFRNDEILGEFPHVPWLGGTTYPVKMHYAGNDTAVAYNEGDADGDAGVQSYLTAYWPEQHYRINTGVTGHVQDYTLNGNASAVFFNQLAEEVPRAVQDLVHKMSTDALGSGLTAPVGILGMIDNAGTLATIVRGTYTWFQAYEAAGASTTIAKEDLHDATYNNRDTTYDGAVNEIWTSWYQGMKWKNALGDASNAIGPIVVMSNGGPGPQPINPGSVTDDQWYGGTPIKKKKGLSNSVWLGLTKQDFKFAISRDWTAKALPFMADTERLQISYGLGFVCQSPKRSWKKTGFTA